VIEIERKFLVTSEIFKKAATSEQLIKQGFLNTDKERTVRVRLYGNKGFLTVKGKSNESGASRFEWEIEILSSEANALLNICEEGTIVKTRYVIPVGKHLFEVDEFHGDNQGLILAEVELNSEEEHFEKPDWLGKEVTGEINYYNSQLSKNPFKTWKK
jgi:CYTH domain-containing protein